MTGEKLPQLSHGGPTRTYQVLPRTSLQPTFVWAAWRALEAGGRAKSLDSLMDHAASQWKAHVLATAHLDDVVGTVRLDFPGLLDEQVEVGRQASIIASEVLHHARAALDYCAHHAAWRDAGVRNARTQFPLAETHREWRSAIERRWLHGCSDEHIEWIREVQPFEGVVWSRHLKRLSNQDKHRVLVEVLPAYRIEVDTSQVLPDPNGDPTRVAFREIERRLDFLIVSGLEDAASAERLPADGVLWDIVKGVIGVVNQFLGDEGLPEISVTETPRSTPTGSPGSQ